MKCPNIVSKVGLLAMMAAAMWLAISCGPSGEGRLGDESGTTECAAAPGGECPAGTYCDSANETCALGCLSSDHCAGTDRCERPYGEPVGQCVPRSVEFSERPKFGTEPSEQPVYGSSCAQLCDDAINFFAMCWDEEPAPGEIEECTQECEADISDEEFQIARQCIDCVTSAGCEGMFSGICDDICEGL